MEITFNMPELPEVETIVQQLNKRVLNKRIKSIEILNKKLVNSKVSEAAGAKIIEIRRRAKHIIIALDNKKYLYISLRMTGHFHYSDKKNHDEDLAPCKKHLMVNFYLNDGSLLTHNSVRRFGFVKLLTKEELDKELNKMGPEPLEQKFTVEKFKEILQKRKKANIKVILMDQKFLAGVGNIYAQEVLYKANINPTRKIESLSPAEIKKLHQKLRELLHLAVKHHGTTVESYVHIEGSGGFQNYLVVYQKQKCPKGHPLKRINLGGRGTFYCPICQK